jgi:hypothetical protein
VSWVFDGGWAFNVYYPFGKGLFKNPDAEVPLPGDKYYIVEMVPPPHYEVVKEEDKLSRELNPPDEEPAPVRDASSHTWSERERAEAN